MLERFRKFLESNDFDLNNCRSLIAISGGLDSVVLSKLFQLAGYSFALAHCNFNLRGKESDGDEVFVKRLAEELKVLCYTRKFETSTHAKERGLSIQMAARELRYQWFDEIKVENGFDYVATAHHKNDVVETVFINMIKGTGIAGLHGIKVLNGSIIRPMLFCTREEIEGFASQEKLEWREDSSNSDSKYIRNFLRKEIIPKLKTINPQLEEKIAQMTNYVAGVESVFSKELEEFKKAVTRFEKDDCYLSLLEIKKIHNWQIFLTHFLLEKGFSYDQINGIIQGIDKTGLIFQNRAIQLNIDRNEIVISSIKGISEYYEISNENKIIATQHFNLEIKIYDRQDYKISDTVTLCGVDMDQLIFPLVVRNWVQGDYFIPIGMTGKKKISDFMIDEKIPLNLKERQLLLISGNEVVWVMGRRIDDRFKISRQTQKVIELKILPRP
ncbi:MAG: tRNA lysidine(34) synthetase TilS [Bacteroidetes bacterium]|nr:tRNA lysidine(34) synthetase TilS [Bacteroidota bacterium]